MGNVKVDIERLEAIADTLGQNITEFEDFTNNFINTVQNYLVHNRSNFVNEYRWTVDKMRDDIKKDQLDKLKTIQQAAKKTAESLKQMDEQIATSIKGG